MRSTAALVPLALLSACAHATVDLEALAGVKRIGVASIVVDRPAAGTADEATLRAAADRGHQLAVESLVRLRGWEVVPLGAFQENPAWRAVLDWRPAPRSWFDPDGMSRLVQAFRPGGAPRVNPLHQVPTRSGGAFAAASGMPVLPWSAFESSPRDPGEPDLGQRPGTTTEYAWHDRRELRGELGRLAAALELDALAVVQLATRPPYGGQASPAAPMAATLILVARSGAAVIDLGLPEFAAGTPPGPGGGAKDPVAAVDGAVAGMERRLAALLAAKP